ncbi:MAG: hypothetical protein DRI44_02120 [Chlamydiae bacterium]|nr:MAG: hypothetical protein DRI44_02120 [Chlamydiota bacterium]
MLWINYNEKYKKYQLVVCPISTAIHNSTDIKPAVNKQSVKFQINNAITPLLKGVTLFLLNISALKVRLWRIECFSVQRTEIFLF